MTVFVVYIIVGVAIIVGQTTVLTMPCLRGMSYDLVIPMVVFFRLNLAVKQGGPLVFLMGFAMDLFSGGSFGLYLTTYFWIFLGVQAVSTFFDVQGGLFRSLLIGLCVLLQNVFFAVFASFPDRLGDALFPLLGNVVLQVFLGAVTGSAIIKGLEYLQRRVASRQQQVENRGRDWVSP
jgi:hypothetical protein